MCVYIFSVLNTVLYLKGELTILYYQLIELNTMNVDYTLTINDNK